MQEYVMQSILGFAEALVVDTDPEFEFEERFRSAQKSNEKRQKQLYHLSYFLLNYLTRSMQLRRQVGKQAKQRGANAVIGYQQFFDMEGDSGIVGRAYGTACMSEYFSLLISSIYPREKDNEKSISRIPSRDIPSPLIDLPLLEEQPKRKDSELTQSRRRRPICEIQTRDIVCKRRH